MKNKYFVIWSAVFFITGILALSKIGRSYDTNTTHPGLTDEIVDFYNLSFGDELNTQEKEWIVQGSIDEDLPPRWINHFYDPTTGEGWLAENLGNVSPATLRFLTKIVFNPNAAVVSSLDWLHNEELQARYASYGGNNTWENGIRQYAAGNKKEAYQILGHVLHLLEDKAVPDHTRNDTHAHEGSFLSADGGSPYEDYSMNFTRQSLNISQNLKNAGRQPAALGSADDYFKNLADYSNKYFFSEHTINSPKYANPKILRQDDKYGYGGDINGSEFPLVKIYGVWNDDKKIYEKVYTLTDKTKNNTILSTYFSRLSEAAVLNGAGLVKLFKDEAEKAVKEQNLIKEAPQVSWWQQLRSPLYGSIAFYEETKLALQELIGKPVVETTKFAVNSADQTGYALAETINQTSVLGQKVIKTIVKPIANGNPLSPKPAQAKTIITTNPLPLPTGPETVIVIPTNPLKPFPSWMFTAGPVESLLEPSSQAEETIIIISTSTPDVTAPTSSINALVAEYNNTGFEVGWQGTDAASGTVSGLAYFETEYRLNGGEWQSWLASTSATSSVFAQSARPDDLIVIRVRAADNAGNLGEWAEARTKIASPPPSPHPVISEVQIAGATANDEFIELYNPTGSDIDLGNYSIQYRGGEAAGFSKKNLGGGWSIKANSYLLIAHNQYAGSVPANISHGSFTMSAEGGTIFLVSNQTLLTPTTTAGSAVVDRLAYGVGANLSPETAPAPAPAAGQSLERKALSTSTATTMAIGGEHYYSGNGYDSNDNSADFVLRATPEPQNYRSRSEPNDPLPACRSIPIDEFNQIATSTLAGGRDPYCVPINQTYIVPAGSQLTIEPGAILKFDANASLLVYGELSAIGTAEKNIVFASYYDNTFTPYFARPAYAGYWTGISVLNGGKLFFDYAKVSNVGRNGWLALAKPKSERNDFRLAMVMILSYSAINVRDAQAVITHSEISCSDTGISVEGSSQVSISDSAIFGNGSGVLSSGPSNIEAVNNWWGDRSGPYHFSDNVSGLGNQVTFNINFSPWLTSWP